MKWSPLLGVGCTVALLSGCAGQSHGVSPLPWSNGMQPERQAVGPVVVSPTSLVFTAVGASHAASVTVSQTGFAGRFLQFGKCVAPIAKVTGRAAGGKWIFTVTPLHAGTCIARFQGGGGKTASLPVSVLPGPVVLAPASLKFTALGASNAKSFAASQTNYLGTLSETNTCAKIATVTASSNAGRKYQVTPIGAGSCSAKVSGGGGQSASLPISVVLPGVVLTPKSLSFSAATVASAKPVAVTQQNYTGTFSESDSCTKVATVVATSNAGGSAKYTVTPTGPGSCSATFKGAYALSASLPIAVTVPLPILGVVCAQAIDACANGTAAKAGSVQFTAKSDTATLTPSDPSWSNAPNFTLKSDTCNKTDDPSAGGNWVSVSPAKGRSAASFTLTALNAGVKGNTANCSAVLADGAGRTVTVNIEVTLGNVGVH